LHFYHEKKHGERLKVGRGIR